MGLLETNALSLSKADQPLPGSSCTRSRDQGGSELRFNLGMVGFFDCSNMLKPDPTTYLKCLLTNLYFRFISLVFDLYQEASQPKINMTNSIPKRPAPKNHRQRQEMYLHELLQLPFWPSGVKTREGVFLAEATWNRSVD